MSLEATKVLHADPQPPRVIVLTTFDADEYVVDAIASGADGFLLEDTPPAQIVEAIHKVADGEPMLSVPTVKASDRGSRDVMRTVPSTTPSV